MPQIRIEHSSSLAGRFDARALALGIHRLTVTHVNATVSACKTRVLDIGDPVIGEGDPGAAMLHVEIGLLAGRTTEAKKALAQAVLALAMDALGEAAPKGASISVDIRDLDVDTYQKTVVS